MDRNASTQAHIVLDHKERSTSEKGHHFQWPIPVLPVYAIGSSLPGYEKIRYQAFGGIFASSNCMAFSVNFGNAKAKERIFFLTG